jgi:hypothetical protein
MSAQPTLVTRYRDTGGTVHELHVHRTADGAWEVLDRTATATNVVDTLMGYDDDRSAAEAVARDYAEQHERPLTFEEDEFVQRADRALDMYRKVATWDGAREKPEGQARFTALESWKSATLARYR